MSKERNWQDFVNLVLGIFTFLSPWLVGHQSRPVVFVNFSIVGFLISFFAITCLLEFKVGEEWTNVWMGAWLLGSPWLLHFTAATSLRWSAVLIGAIVIICSALALSKERDRKHLAK
jgi:SPW repeat